MAGFGHLAVPRSPCSGTAGRQGILRRVLWRGAGEPYIYLSRYMGLLHAGLR
jgi:hypothetical protein